MTVALSLACTDYEWLEPLVHGDVEPEGIDLTVLSQMGGGERHRRAMRGEFDAAEFSLGTYTTGWPDWEFTAIPVFPRRFFPHSRTFVSTGAGIESPADLAGKRVGIISYQNTLALWARGVFADQYGLDLETVQWHAVSSEPVDVDPPVSITRTDRSEIPRRLAEGDLDAYISPTTAAFTPLPDGVGRLFGGPWEQERAYYDETGFYPVMHNVVVQDGVVDEHPWVPTELLSAFRESFDAFVRRRAYEAKYPLVWQEEYREREADIVGDIWGRSAEFDANADELETLIDYANDQGLTDGPLDPAEMFHEGTLSD